MGMKFFRVKMYPVEDFEASFQFMQVSNTIYAEYTCKCNLDAFAELYQMFFFFFLNCCPFVQTQQLSVAMAHIAKWVTIRGEVCQELSVNVFQALLGAVNGALAFSLKFIQWLGEKNTRCSVVPLSEFPTVLMEHAMVYVLYSHRILYPIILSDHCISYHTG